MSFDANDYRKRVLAGIEARGGVQTSDPFEWYDLPVDDDLPDAAVAVQVEAVWGFWQKSRDSPKYRGLVTALLAAHGDAAPLLLERSSRRLLAEQSRRARRAVDADRWAPLDAAVARLVERFGGVPRSKLPGLRELALTSGLPAAAVDERLRSLAVVETRAAPPALVVPDDVRRQVRADLDELGRLLGEPPFATLHELLGLAPDASREQVRSARDVAAARNRELRPDRRRALVDDLLAAATRLLVDGDPDAYLDAVADDVRDRLRPRLAAVLLVEDVITPADAAALRAEAQAAGLDPGRATRVLAGLAAELGTPLPPTERARATRTSLRGGADTGRVRPAPPTPAAPPPAPAAPAPPPPPEPVTGVQAVRVAGGVLVRWQASPSAGDVDYRVQRHEPGGRVRTVGTTRATELEDGARLDGRSLPLYTVEARRAGQASAPARSDGGTGPAPVTATGTADPAPVSGLRAVGDFLRWEWPPGCTEVLVVWRADAPPTGVDDPSAQRRKTTNTRYELDGGAPLPPQRPLHVTVLTCVRVRGELVPARSAPPGAQLSLAAVDGPGTGASRH